MRRLAAVVLALVAGQLASVATEGPEQHAGLASVDAIVADAQGRIVSSLTVEDFEVIEDGRQRRVDNVRFIPPPAPDGGADSAVAISSKADERFAAAPDDVRLVAVYLDEYHVSRGETAIRARQLVERLIATGLGTRDLVTVVRPLDALPDIRLTHDRQAILRALDGFSGRKGDYEARTAFERAFIASDHARIDAVRTQIAMSALNAIAFHLGTLKTGRKTLIVVSEGFARGARQRGEEGLPSLDSVIRSANRNGVSIYPIDPRALGAADATSAARADDRELEPLRTLAAETGGRALLDVGEIEPGLRRAVADSSGYYLVAFESATEGAGRFHQVQVRVKRSGIDLRARSGYWLPPAPVVTATRTTSQPLPVLTPRPSRLMRSWFGVVRGDDGKTRVRFVWEPAPPIPGAAALGAPAQVALRVLQPDGTPVIEREVAPSVPPSVARAEPTDRIVEFNLASERLRVQMSVLDGDQKLLEINVRDLVAHALTGAMSVGTPQVFRARSAKEFRDIETDPSPLPAATRDFTRADRLLIRLPVYTAAGAVSVSAGLAADLGAKSSKTMRELAVTDGDGVRQIDLSLAGLPAGDYRVEMIAVNGSNRERVSLLFRIQP